ncbi:MAG: hypothetical protein K2K18_02150, partial [Malacoplasma sp.]|nr:hypothetical protein [Malacoplasma sp.]
MFKNKKKNILFSLFLIPLISSYATFFVDTNKSSIVQISSNFNSDIADNSINYEDSFPVANTSITKLSDYIVSYEDNNIYPVNVNNANIGMTYDFTTLTYTTYGGLLLWSSDLTKNPLIKKYYSSVLKIDNIGSYRVNNFTYQKNTNLLYVLFGNKNKQNQIVFAIDIYTGKINIPPNAFLKDNQIITNVTDGSGFIFFNSQNQIIVTSGGTKNNVDKSTKIFTYSPKSKGFTYLKQTIDLAIDNPTDFLIGIIPGNNGTNYGYYVSTINPNQNKTVNFNIAESQSTTFNTAFYSYAYYMIPINDNLSTKNSSKTFVDSRKNFDFIFGYISSANKTPNFDDIYKRIFKLENASNTNSIYMFALIDSYYKFLDSYSMISATGLSIQASPSKGFVPVRDSSNNQQLIPIASDFSPNEKVIADSWKFDNFGYDSDTNLFYFSFSGQKINTSTNKSDGYMSKMGYFQFQTTSLSINTTKFSNENNWYSLYSVGYDSYSSKNYYMNKQLSNSEPVWLSRAENQTEYAPIANSNTSFAELNISTQNLIQQIEGSNLFKETMPENITEAQLNDLISKLTVNNGNIKILKISSDNKTGIISARIEITQTNQFGDGVANGNTQYVFEINISGYSMNKDFIFKFITTDMVNIGFNDKINKINEIKESTGPSGISKSQILNYFLDANILGKDNKHIEINEDWITPKPNDELGYLVVEAVLPEELFPIGFPKENLSATAVYKDFWVHVDPLPPDPIPGNDSSYEFFINKDEGEKIGIISGVIVGLVLIITTMFVLI